MRLLAFLRNHAHYWGIPHPRDTEDDTLVQTCYECGAERVVKIELRPPVYEEIVAPLHDDHLAA
jgi:hypothetical protein